MNLFKGGNLNSQRNGNLSLGYLWFFKSVITMAAVFGLFGISGDAQAVYTESFVANEYQGAGTAQGWRDDDGAWSYTLPFTFNFYGTNYSTIKVSSNGYICLNSAYSCTAYNQTLAGTGNGPIIALLARDLKTNTLAENNIFITANADNVVIRWNAVVYGQTTVLNFEAVLYSNGAIKFNYGPQAAAITTGSVVGISKGDGTYVTSAYNNITNFNLVNTSSWIDAIPTVPVIETVASSGITPNAAVANGNITSTGNATTTRYMEWGTVSGTYTSSCTAGIGGVGAYSCNMTGLTPDTTYYVRAKAVNSVGTAYGTELSFQTSPLSIPVVTTGAVTSVAGIAATGNGDVVSTGGENPTSREIEWGTVSGTYTNSCDAGTGASGAYTCSMTGLSLDTTYYVRAKATNSIGVGYGNEVSFTTLDIPTVTTQEVTSIAPMTAVGNGTIVSTGGASTTRYIEWGTESGVYISSCDAGAGAEGAYVCNMSGLTPDTTYYVRAKAVSSVGTTYGSELSFQTTPVIIPTVTIDAVSSIIGSTATGNGNVTDTGGEEPIRYIEWGTESGTYTDSCNVGAGSVGAYSCSITDLSLNTTYYVRAKATNFAGAGYSSEISFTTLNIPTVTTQDVTSISVNSAVGNGTIVEVGGEVSLIRYIEWGTVSGTYTNSCNAAAGELGSYTCDMTNLLANTTYYVRAKAVSSVGTAYGTELSFQTAPAAISTVTTGAASSITGISAVGNGNVANTGGENPTNREIEWGTESGVYTNSCDAGAGATGAYNCNITGLTSNTTYYIRAKVTNGIGIGYGEEITFTTLTIVPSTITTDATSLITSFSARGNGSIVEVGNDNPVRYIEWGTESGVYTNSCSAGVGSAGAFYCSMTNLNPNTTYYVRAKANNLAGVSYGNESSFTTVALSPVANLASSTVYAIANQADGKTIIGGDFTSYNGIAINRIARLNADGTLDTSFTVGTGAGGYVYAMAIQADGKIVIGGAFTTYNGTAINRIARLNTDGTLDTTFTVGTGAGSYVRTISIQSDGKIIVGGEFTSFSGVAKNRIVRLNTDGTLDTTFSGTGAGSYVYSSAIQADGKIVIGGYFTSYNGTTINRIARLNTDGTLDTTFTVGTGAGSYVRTISIQSADQKIIIGGDFSTYNGITANRIARINTDGTLDTTFVSTVGANGSIYSNSIQSDGKILIGGGFYAYNGITTNYVARLNADGSLDNAFTVGTGANNYVYATLVQSDGKIIIGGAFGVFNGLYRNRIAFLNADGTDNSAVPPIYLAEVTTNAATVITATTATGNGNVTGIGNESPTRSIEWGTTSGVYTSSCTAGIGGIGAFTCAMTGLSQTTTYYVRTKVVNSAGVAYGNEVSFETLAIASPTLTTSAASSITGVSATGYGNVTSIGYENPTREIEWGTVSGTYTNSCSAGVGATGSYSCSMTGLSLNTTYYVRAKATNSAGVSYGSEVSFTTLDMPAVSTQDVSSIAATTATGNGTIVSTGGVNPTRYIEWGITSGTYTTSCNAGTGTVGVYTCSMTGLVPNTKYYARAKAITAAGTVYGTEVSFQTATGPTAADLANYYVYATAVQSDGKMIIGGDFTKYNGTSINRIARLNVDGTLDTTFNVGTGANSYSVYAIAIQSDGKIIIGGDFATYNGTTVNRIARLNIDGTLDTTFVSTGIGMFTYIQTISIQSDGKIIIGGNFTAYSGTAINRIARLNTDGTLDTTFTVGTGANNYVYASAIQSDGKIVIGGSFTTYNGVTANRIARLNTDGTLDTTFAPTTGAGSTVRAISLQSDGKIIIGGEFTTYNSTTRNRIARINTDGTLDTTFAPTTGASLIVLATAIQSDGQILIAGNFSTYNSVSRVRVARINTNGTLDTTFTVGTGANNAVYASSILSDGRIIIGGTFTNYNGLSRNYVAFLNADGTSDASIPPTYTPLVTTNEVTAINAAVATGNGNITSIGNESPVRSIEWGTTSGVYTNSCSAGTGSVGTFSCSMTNLAQATTYYARAKATNSAGTVYGAEVSFQTQLIMPPTLTTSSASSITGISAAGNGNVVNTGYENPTRYIEWGTVSGVYTNSCSAGTGATGTYTCSMTGLSLGTTYYVRAKAVNSAGVGYGNEISFITLSVPTVTTYNISTITANSAIGGGIIIYTGGVNPTRYIEWGTVSGVYTNSCNASTGAEGNYTCAITGLLPETTYYFRAKATNTAGTGYGSEMTFQTDPTEVSTLTTSAVTSIAGSTAVGNGNITYTGGENPTRYIEWGTASGIYTNSCSAGTGATGAYACSMTGLSNYTTYYVRAKAINSAGESYGNEVTFITSAAADLANSSIHVTAIQADGKIIIGGQFTFYNGTAINRIARLNADGTLDTTFNVGTGTNDAILDMAIQSDGKIIIGGYFTTYNGTTINRIARLNTDGTLDGTFAVGSGASNYVRTISIQSDGKVIIGGDFSTYNGTTKNYIARLNTDGTLDATFTGTGAGNYVYASAIQADGKIIIGGTFTSYNGTGINYIARLNTDGTLDTSLNVGTGASTYVRTISIQSDGKIIIGGDFITYNSISRKYIARLNTDGTLDTTLAGLGPNGSIYTTAIQPDGKIIIGGAFTSYNGNGANRIARINADGIFDVSFSVGTGASANVRSSVIQSDGKIIIGGEFVTYNNVVRKYIARLKADGSNDSIFGETPHAPFVATSSVTSIVFNSAIGNGNIASTGGDNPERIIEWGTVSGTYTNSCTVGVGGTGTYSCNMTGLNPLTTYYVRAKATNIYGTSYGSEISFATPAVLSVETQTPSYISSISAIMGGQIISTGGDNPIAMIEWGTESGVYLSSCSAGISGVGTYSCNLNNLTPLTTYYARAKVTNITGTVYGGEISFQTYAENADGEVDLDFLSRFSGVDGISEFDEIYDFAVQSDGKFVILGYFGTYNAVEVENDDIARLNADGTLDKTFNSGGLSFGDSDYATSVEVQPDDKILIGGHFDSYNGVAVGNIARLNADGTLDTAFNSGTGFNDDVEDMTVQPDGKILVTGQFTSYNNSISDYICRDSSYDCDSPSFIDYNSGGAACATDMVNCDDANDCGTSMIGFADARAACGYDVGISRIARLNTDGTLDTSFVGTGASGGSIQNVFLQSDGKMIVGGSFTSIDGVTVNRIARLNADGTLDTSFNVGTGANNTVSAIAVGSDGKVMIGGWFTSYNSVAISRVARLNNDGSLDATFNPGLGPTKNGDDGWYTAGIIDIGIQSDGKMLIGGWFGLYDGQVATNMVRINPDGSLDTSYDFTNYYMRGVYEIEVQPDNSIFVAGGGAWISSIELYRGGIVHYNSDMSVDIDFNRGRGPNGTVHSVAVQSDGKMVVGGYFSTYDDFGRLYIARANADGSVDETFDPGTGANEPVYVVSVQTDGKIIIGGDFTIYNGTAVNRIARLNADGTLDTTFAVGAGFDDEVYAVAIQSDGKIIIGGKFNTYNGEAADSIVRLNADGTLDTSFEDSGTGGIVKSISIYPDGKIIVGGDFSIVRLNTDGTLDTSFENLDIGGIIYSISLYSDGKILVGGRFIIDGILRNIARLNVDGTLDDSFKYESSTSLSTAIFSTAIQTDEKIIIAGEFLSYNGSNMNNVTRLNRDGTLDTSFVVKDGVGRYDNIYSVVIQQDNKIVVGGDFVGYESSPALYLTRLHAASSIVAPVVETDYPTYLSETSLIGSSNIIDTGGENTERFIEWGTTSGNYTNSCSAGTGGLGSYSCTMNNLSLDTTYYIRAKATNSVGTVYGEEKIYIHRAPLVETIISHEFNNGGVAQNWKADEGTWGYELPFDFTFYGTTYSAGTSIGITSNGQICLEDDTDCSDYYNSIANTTHGPFIAPMWVDLDSRDGDIYITEESNRIIIRWEVEEYGETGILNFEAILYANGNIKFNYGEQAALLTMGASVGISNGKGHYVASVYNNNKNFDNSSTSAWGNIGPDVVSFTPVDNSSDIIPDSDLSITFNKNVLPGTGNITIKKVNDDSTVKIIDVTSGNITGWGSSTLNINHERALNYFTEYYVIIDNTAIKDENEDLYLGVSDKNIWNFTTVSMSEIVETIPSCECYVVGSAEAAQPANTTLSYSNDNQISWTYIPSGAAGESDCNVTDIKMEYSNILNVDGEDLQTEFTGDFSMAKTIDEGNGKISLAYKDNLKTYIIGEAAGQEYGSDIAVDSNGNVIMTGVFQYTVDFDITTNVDNHVSKGGHDIYITKHNADGTYGWTRTFGGTGWERTYGAMDLSADGDIFVTGRFEGTVNFDGTGGIDNHTSNGGDDIYVTKYNADGSYGWTRTFGGSSDYDDGSTVAVDSLENVFVVGYYGSTTDFDGTSGTDIINMGAPTYSGFITKYNADGSYGWTREVAGTNTSSGQDIEIDSSGNPIYQGYGGGSLTVKYDTNGNQIWRKDLLVYGLSGETVDLDNNGNMFVTGRANGTFDFDISEGVDNHTVAGAFITKYNADGSYGWTRAFLGNPNDSEVDSQGNIYVVGYFDISGNQDAFIVKYDTNGEQKWMRNFGSSNSDVAHGINISNNDEIFVTGYVGSTTSIDMDATEGVDVWAPPGNLDTFKVVYGTDGSYKNSAVSSDFIPRGIYETQIQSTEPLDNWGVLSIVQETPTNTSILHEVLDQTCTTSLIAQTANTSIDLSSIDRANESLCLKSTLITTDNQVTPKIDSWSASSYAVSGNENLTYSTNPKVGCTVLNSPTLNTNTVSSILSTSVTGNASITNTGGEDPVREIEWGTTSGVYTNSCSAGTGGVGAYSCNITGLSLNTTYYIRAKATNSIGTSYGEEIRYNHAESLNETIVPNEFQGDGVAKGWRADDGEWEYTLPFAFNFYGTDYTNIKIGSNGIVCLDNTKDCTWYPDPDFNNTSNGPVIVPMGIDLRTNVNAENNIYITENTDNVVIRWNAAAYGSTDNLEFEVVLFNNGNFKFNYGSQISALAKGAVVGIANGNGTYAQSAYDGFTGFNNIDTSAWGEFPIALTYKFPADNAVFAPADSSLTATFNRNVIQGSGNILIKKKSDNTVLETIDVASANVTGWSSSILEINPTNLLPPSSQIYINIEPGAMKDSENNDFEGIADTNTWNFSTINTIVKTILTGACYKVGSAELTQPANTVLSYSNDNQSTWTYIPVAQGDGGDCNVTDIKLTINESDVVSEDIDAEFLGTFDQTETNSDAVSLIGADLMRSYSYSLNSATAYATAYSVITDSIGNVITTGFFRDTVNFDDTGGTDEYTDVGNSDIFITKYNVDGSYDWTRVIGGTGDDYGFNVSTDSNNNVYVAGSFSATADFDGTSGTDVHTAIGLSDIFITKYNADGSYGWTRVIGGANGKNAGLGIAVHGSNVFVTGYFSGDTVDFDGTSGTDEYIPINGSDIFVTKYGTDGSYGWTRAFGAADTWDDKRDIAIDASGNIFVTGYFINTGDFDGTAGVDSHSTGGGRDVFITKYNADGSYGWTRTFGGPGGDYGTGIAISNSGDVYVSGYFAGTVDFDATGGVDTQSSVDDDVNTFFTKYNADGSYGWTRIIADTQDSYAYDIAVDDTDGGIYVTGYFENLYTAIDFDATSGTDLRTAKSVYSDIFITKYFTDGSYGWTRNFGGNYWNAGQGVDVDNGRVHVAGYFVAPTPANFDDTGGTDLHSGNTSSSWDIFMATYNTDGSYPYHNVGPIYPNAGTYQTQISPNNALKLTELNLNSIVPENTIASYTILDDSCTNVLINSTSNSTIDLTSLNALGLCLQVNLETTDNQVTPQLNSWSANYIKESLITDFSYELVALVGPQLILPTPANNAAEVLVGINIVSKFDRIVEKGTGKIHIKKKSDDSIIESIDVENSNITGWGTDTLTIDPTNDLPGNTEIYINIDPTALMDSLGDFFFGIADNTTWTFTTQYIGPQLILPTPANNAAEVLVGINIVSKFDRIVEKGTGKIHIKKKSDDSIIEEIDVQDSNITGWGTDTLTIDPTNDLPANTEIYINIDPTALVDSLGNYFFGITDNTTWTFTTENITVEGPQIVTPFPSDNATNISPDSNLTINFDRPVEVGTGNIDIINATDDSIIETIDITSGNVTGWSTDTLTINPTNNLPSNTPIYINIDPTAIVDTLGNYFFGITDNSTWTFTTGSTVGPQIILPTPANNAADVQVNINIVSKFDRIVEKGTGKIHIKKKSDDSIIEEIDVEDSNITGWGTDTLTIDPTNDLPGNTEIYINIEPTALVDSLNNYFFGITDNTTWTFTTQYIGPQIITPLPADNATNIDPTADLTINFDRVVEVGTGNIDIINATNDSIIETIDITSANVTGWSTDTLTINPTNDLPGNTEIYINIDPTAIVDTLGNYFFGITDNTTWTFTTENITTEGPQIVTPSPADDATNIALDADLIINFDRPVEPGTGTIDIIQAEDNSIIEAIDVNSDNITGWGSDTLTINPTDNLPADTDIYINIEPGAVVDTLGNYFFGINDSSTWSFRTGDASTVGPQLINPSPANNSTNISPDANLSTKFDRPVYPGEGNFHIKNKDDNSEIETIDVNSSNITGWSTDTLTINPINDLPVNTEVYITIDSGALKDVSGSFFFGITDPATWNFITGEIDNDLEVEIISVKDIQKDKVKVRVEVKGNNKEDEKFDFKVEIKNKDDDTKDKVKIKKVKVSDADKATLEISQLLPNTSYSLAVSVSEVGEDDFSEMSDSKSITTLEDLVKLEDTQTETQPVTNNLEDTLITNEEEREVENQETPVPVVNSLEEDDNNREDKKETISAAVTTTLAVIGLIPALTNAFATTTIPFLPLTPGVLRAPFLLRLFNASRRKFLSALRFFPILTISSNDKRSIPFDRKENNKFWGVVFDSYTKQPIMDAVIYLVSLDKKRVIEHVVTDEQGRYGFLIGETGRYALEVKKGIYQIATTTKEDSLYGNIYTQPIDFNSGDLFHLNVALVAPNFNWHKFSQDVIRRYNSFFFKFLSYLLDAIYVAGMILSVYNVIYYPSFFNYLALAFYIGLLIFRLVFKDKKKFGIVSKKETKSPLPFTVVALHDIVNKQRLNFAVTDVLGRYYLLAKNGSYALKLKYIDMTGGSYEKEGVANVEKGIFKKDFEV
ncbi:MAG: Ig-like domain-containing protein [Candidatus Moraniibacteriota bacterium]